ncbi:hypothetical protein ElyMa_006567000 [Elysia marginata]|uniref:Uncharacterized protein n=1 Tax=Elysia marginata TaxID=1093978 RepID=A0AAV4IA36_9GAST|nr:hypothetical protein ElyMa_006567000 [Elysia marginata]
MWKLQALFLVALLVAAVSSQIPVQDTDGGRWAVDDEPSDSVPVPSDQPQATDTKQAPKTKPMNAQTPPGVLHPKIVSDLWQKGQAAAKKIFSFVTAPFRKIVDAIQG